MPLTIVIGLLCKDGIIIATDTQQEFGRGVEVKRLDANKIYSIDSHFAVAGAGAVAHIEKSVSAIKIGLSTAKDTTGEQLLTEQDCITTLEKTMTSVHKEYNIDRSRFLDDPKEREFFNPILISGGFIKDEKNEKTSGLFILHAEGIVEKIANYATIGSGAAYAELLLKDLYYDDIPISEALPIAAYTINEVKSIDPNCGGDTRIAYTYKGTVKELRKPDITELSTKTLPLLEIVRKKIVPRIVRGKINEEELRKII